MWCDLPLDEDNFLLFAAHHYTNLRQGGLPEFYEDVGRLRSLRRLCRRFTKTGELKERLILNHVIALFNVFEHEAAVKMLIFHLYDYLDILQPFLAFLGYWPPTTQALHRAGVKPEDLATVNQGHPVVEAKLAAI